MPINQLAGAISDLSELSLLCRISARDRDALDRLYHSYYGKLVQFLANSIGGRESIERVDEIINDTFMEFWGTTWNSRQRSPIVSTCIFQVAFQKALEYMDQRRSAEERGGAAQCADLLSAVH
jgi:DNA-directed RNA polymerase specialized sigma24 family protein